MNLRVRYIGASVCLFMFLLAAGSALAQGRAAVATDPKAAAPEQIIPVDPQVTVGTLPNGLRYYIRKNTLPQNRAELRLVVNAGSVLEEEDQRGIAHFIEHMAFNGTKNVSRYDLISFMESIGMKMGPNVNAFTSFDETVYMLQVPTESMGILDRSFLILEDWAHNISFDPRQVERERGVIIEEWRLGRGAAARLQDKQFPVLFKGSRYADRLPIGQPEIVQTVKADALKKFYGDWYRPDLMAVVAVGDFDKSAVESLIKQHFSRIPVPAQPKPRPVCPVPDHDETLYAISTDKEMTMTTVGVYNMLPIEDQATVGSYRQKIVERLYLDMLNGRLLELSQKADGAFLAARATHGIFVKSKEVSTLSAGVRDGRVEPGLEALLVESERVARFGFTATELDRQKRDTLRAYERLYAERDKHESSTLAAEYIRAFTEDEDIPGIAYEYELQKRFLPLITLEEVNAVAKKWNAERNRVVVVSGPQKQGIDVPDQARLQAVINGVKGKKVEPYVDMAAGSTLLENQPKAGSIVSTRETRYGITEWQLSNGVKVVLKPTDFKADEVLVRAVRFGGTSLAADQDYVAAETATAIVTAGGLGKFNATELRKVLAGKAVSVMPTMSETEEGLAGGASPKDLEALFQMIYLSFTEPHRDADAFAALMGQLKALLVNQNASPGYAFNLALTATLSQNHFRTRAVTPEIIDREASLDKSLAFYKQRFSNANGFTFIFVGSIDIASIKPLVERYLAALPSGGPVSSYRDVGIRAPKGVVKKVVEQGIEPKSQTSIVFNGAFVDDVSHRAALRALADLLGTTLRTRLRQSMSGTYSLSATASSAKVPEAHYRLTINFGCDPGRVDELVAAVFEEINQFKLEGPTEKQLDDEKALVAREFETSSRQNGYLAAQLQQKYLYGEDLSEAFALVDVYARLTPSDITESARRYLNTGNYVQVTLLPEKKAGGATSQPRGR